MMLAGKPTFILDTGPLSVLCGYPTQGQPYIGQVLSYVNVVIPEGVVVESSAGKIARTILPLIKAGQISVTTAPSQPDLLDRVYDKLLGIGERSVIKIALSTDFESVIDDKDAFMVANRFGVRPMVFHDFMLNLVHEQAMPVSFATDIVTTTARQYPSTYLAHTLELLRGS